MQLQLIAKRISMTIATCGCCRIILEWIDKIEIVNDSSDGIMVPLYRSHSEIGINPL